MVPPLFVDNIEKKQDMIISSKHNVGDILYTTDAGKILEVEVSAISPYVSKHKSEVTYYFKGIFRGYNEDDVFKSREELINHLMGRDGEND